jgi:hypothetical protein
VISAKLDIQTNTTDITMERTISMNSKLKQIKYITEFMYCQGNVIQNDCFHSGTLKSGSSLININCSVILAFSASSPTDDFKVTVHPIGRPKNHINYSYTFRKLKNDSLIIKKNFFENI